MDEAIGFQHLPSGKILDSIFATAIDCMIVIDSFGKIMMVNGAAVSLFGYEKEELVGHKINILMPEPHHSQHDHYLKNYKETGQAKIIGKGREEWGKRKDGSLFPMRLSVTRMEINGVLLFTGIIHDRTDLRAAEAEIERMNRELERKVVQRTLELEEKHAQLIEINHALNREINEREQMELILRDNQKELQAALEKEKELNELKSRFVSMASHEFRTPLSTILSSAGLITRYPEELQQSQRIRHVDRIKSAVSLLTGILDDFLSLAKLEEGRISFNSEAFSLRDLADEVVEELKPNLKPGQSIQFDDKLTSDQLIQDRNLLKHMLYNLLSNAIKYSPEQKPITLRCQTDGPFILLDVEDQGIGIPIQDQHRLFTRFFRAKNAMNIQGTGLGLNIVRHYVTLMGGEIDFTSSEGKGSVFNVRIPAEQQVNND